MAKLPSMAVADCEAALGPKGSLRCTPDNRPMLRKWLCASGYPAIFVHALSKFELAAAYNSQSGMDAIKRKYESAKAEGDAEGRWLQDGPADPEVAQGIADAERHKVLQPTPAPAPIPGLDADQQKA